MTGPEERSALVVYDDATARTFAPFALTRPLAAVRAGADLIAARWARALHIGAPTFVSSPHLTGFHSGGLHAASGVLAPGTILASGRCVVRWDARAQRSSVPGGGVASGNVWMAGERVAAVRLTKPLPVEALRDGSLDLETLAHGVTAREPIAGRWMDAPWDLIRHLPDQLLEDADALATEIGRSTGAVGERIGSRAIAVERGAVIEPFVMLDASIGAIVIREGAHISAFTRIAGPCVIGARTHVLGGRISGSAIGDDCRIHGDLSASIVIDRANKAHEGFVGHSIIGEWANLGAGTTTSNLKNSYGSVRMWAPGGEQDTGLTFLGSLIGDHAKLGIGTMLGTGTVIGAGANVYGGVQPPKRVEPFAWGGEPPFATFALDKFLAIAARVTSRRNITLDQGQQAVLARAHEIATSGEW